MRVVLFGEAPMVAALGERADRAQLDARRVDVGAAAWEGAVAVAADADVVVELVDTDLARKREVVARLAERMAKGATLVTSILAAPAAEVATWLPPGTALAGVALLAPVTDTSVVEIAGLPRRGDAAEAARRFGEALGLATADIADTAGGVLPRIVACLVNEAAFALGEGIATGAAIDQAMRLGTAYPRGPLAWGNLVGLRRVVAILEGLHRETPDGRYRVAPLLRRLARLDAGFELEG